MKNIGRYFKRDRFSNKYTNGHCLIIGGSADYTGAVYLAGRAAYRAGAGIVTLAVPQELKNIFQIKCTEELILPLPSVNGYIVRTAAQEIIRYMKERKVNSVVLGPGISRNESTGDFIKALLPGLAIPVIVDADAIFLSRDIKFSAGNAIITPHEGELSNFLKKDKKEINQNRIVAAKSAAVKISGVCILKGHRTVITDGRRVRIDSTGSAVLATAGSGDVLSGILGAVTAQAMRRMKPGGSDLLEIAETCVRIHSSSGKLAERKRKFGIVASDMIDEIGNAIVSII